MAYGTVTEQLDSSGRGVPGVYSPQAGIVLPQAGTVASDANNNGQQYAPTSVELNDGKGNVVTVGQKTMAHSIPVAFASDQTVTITTAQIAGSHTAAIAAGKATDTVVSASSGFLVNVLVTASGTNTMVFYDNATTHSGTIVGVVPANSAVGSVHTFPMPVANGIVAYGNANNPAVTVGYA